MLKVSTIGNLLKKSYRLYSQELLSALQDKGYIDLRVSFLEILMYLAEESGPTIKSIGHACGLKKQTMTSHLNELEKRGYIIRKVSPTDKREFKVYLSDYGEKFKVAFLEVASNLEKQYSSSIGEVEMDRIIHVLENFHLKIKNTNEDQKLLI